MASKENNTIRFAVGDKGDVRSSIWRLWANGNDLYLAARSYAHISKISFHQSGLYRFAINDKVERENDASDRVLYKWKRPDEFIPGWTRCFGLLFPPRVTQHPFANVFAENKAIQFIEPPAAGRKVILNIILSHKAARSDHVTKGCATGAKILGRIDMPRELAWLISFSDAFTSAESATVSDHFNKLKLHLKPGSSGAEVESSFLHALEEGVTPFLIDIELGRESLEISDGGWPILHP
jgi:hypothetical protein